MLWILRARMWILRAMVWILRGRRGAGGACGLREFPPEGELVREPWHPLPPRLPPVRGTGHRQNVGERPL
eukprot:881035-Pyramimonas_sp.AAC.1